jgi:hypothetical protein
LVVKHQLASCARAKSTKLQFAPWNVSLRDSDEFVIGSLFLLVLVSFGVDALRRRPAPPKALYWAPKSLQTTISP